jgi:hypothetical protein
MVAMAHLPIQKVLHDLESQCGIALRFDDRGYCVLEHEDDFEIFIALRGRDLPTAGKHRNAAADDRVARLATEQPERFAKLFEMRKSLGGPKHGTAAMRRSAYALLYARAAEGASIQELELFKGELTKKMDEAGSMNKHWVEVKKLVNHYRETQADDLHQYAQMEGTDIITAAWKRAQKAYKMRTGISVPRERPAASLIKDFNGSLMQMSDRNAAEVAHGMFPELRPDRIGWSKSNIRAQEDNEQYTRDTKADADAVAARFPEHLDYMVSKLGLTTEEAAYALTHIRDRLRHLAPPQKDDFEGGGIDQTRPEMLEDYERGDVGDVSDPRFTPELKKMMAATNYESQSDFAGRDRLYKRDPDVRDKRLDTIRAVLYATALAHPDKAKQLKPFEAQMATFNDRHLNDLQRLVNVDQAPPKDELFNHVKTVADESDRARGIGVQ